MQVYDLIFYLQELYREYGNLDVQMYTDDGYTSYLNPDIGTVDGEKVITL